MQFIGDGIATGLYKYQLVGIDNKCLNNFKICQNHHRQIKEARLLNCKPGFTINKSINPFISSRRPKRGKG